MLCQLQNSNLNCVSLLALGELGPPEMCRLWLEPLPPDTLVTTLRSKTWQSLHSLCCGSCVHPQQGEPGLSGANLSWQSQLVSSQESSPNQDILRDWRPSCSVMIPLAFPLHVSPGVAWHNQHQTEITGHMDLILLIDGACAASTSLKASEKNKLTTTTTFKSNNGCTECDLWPQQETF